MSELIGRRIDRDWERLKLTSQAHAQGIPRTEHDVWRREIRKRCRAESDHAIAEMEADVALGGASGWL